MSIGVRAAVAVLAVGVMAAACGGVADESGGGRGSVTASPQGSAGASPPGSAGAGPPASAVKIATDRPLLVALDPANGRVRWTLELRKLTYGVSVSDGRVDRSRSRCLWADHGNGAWDRCADRGGHLVRRLRNGRSRRVGPGSRLVMVWSSFRPPRDCSRSVRLTGPSAGARLSPGRLGPRPAAVSWWSPPRPTLPWPSPRVEAFHLSDGTPAWTRDEPAAPAGPRPDMGRGGGLRRRLRRRSGHSRARRGHRHPALDTPRWSGRRRPRPGRGVLAHLTTATGSFPTGEPGRDRRDRRPDRYHRGSGGDRAGRARFGDRPRTLAIARGWRGRRRSRCRDLALGAAAVGAAGRRIDPNDPVFADRTRSGRRLATLVDRGQPRRSG